MIKHSPPVAVRVARRRSAVVPFAARLALLAGCLAAAGTMPQSASAQGGMPPPQVEVEEVSLSRVPVTLELPATLAGAREVEIRARVSGILETRRYDEGARVRRGQLLFELDAAPFQAALARNEADLLAARARLDQARMQLTRLEPLRAEKAVARKDYDDALSAEAIAEADVKAVEARLQEARLNLGYTRVESPIDGVAGRALVSEGTYVTGPELLLTRVTQLDPVHVRFGLSEREQLRLRQEAETGALKLPAGGRWQARIKLPDGSIHPQAGVVNFSDVRINPETGTSEMQAVVPNPDGSLRAGQFVRVLLEGAYRPQAVVVPQRAVLDSGTGKYVYLLATAEDGSSIARQAPVEVGEWVRVEGRDGVENGWVIRKGLQAGDPVIVDGMARIFFSGMPVVRASTAEPTAPANARN